MPARSLSFVRGVWLCGLLLSGCAGAGQSAPGGPAAGAPDGAAPAVEGGAESPAPVEAGLAPVVDAAGDSGAASDGLPASDAGTVEVTVRTHSSALQGGFGPQTSTTWVAWQDGTGPWQVLAPRGTGAYAFAVTGTRYGVALVCATPGAGLTIGTLYYRTTATRELLLPVGEFCDESKKPEPAVVRGRVENPGMSRWVSMGWAGGSEGMLINPAATAPLFNYDFSITTFGLRASVKDFSFGLREFTGRSPLTRMAFHRRLGNVPPPALDFTQPALETTQTASFAVGRRLLRITGAAAGEVVKTPVYYATSDVTLGLDMSDDRGYYATVPLLRTEPSDRYVGQFEASADLGRRRALTFSFKQPVDLDLSFPDAITAPAVTVAASAPYLRLKIEHAGSPRAASYTITAESVAGAADSHSWTTSIAADWLAQAAVVDTLPDFSQLPGWRNQWALPAGRPVTVRLTVNERRSDLSDGYLEPSSGNATVLPDPR